MSAEPYLKRLHLPSLSIKGFRGISDLSIPRLGRVTLITGMNNTGKTSILEAVRLLAEEGALETIRELLQLREEGIEALSDDGESPSGQAFLLSALFNGFPRIPQGSEPILISCADGSRRLEMEVGWFIDDHDESGNSRLIPLEPDMVEDEIDSLPALVVNANGRTRIYPTDRIDRPAGNRRLRFRIDSGKVSSRFVNASGSERTESLGPLWDNISLTERETYVVEALRIIDRRISAVSMVGENSLRGSRTAVVRSENFDRRVPLRSFGDGMNRLFGIILSLVNVSGGILLVDEFENGMHHAVQVDAWRLVFRLSETLNVQVLATTHSFDCVAGFRQAAAEMEQTDGLLIRVDRNGDRMRVVEYSEEDLQIAVSQRIEVR